jgi:hypothetical protein
MGNCEWSVSGTLLESTYKTTERGKSYWILNIRVDDGLLGLYVHDSALRDQVESLALGSTITARGVIEPHKYLSALNKPYFLTCKVIEANS